jgi:hypothetical protein
VNGQMSAIKILPLQMPCVMNTETIAEFKLIAQEVVDVKMTSASRRFRTSELSMDSRLQEMSKSVMKDVKVLYK